MAVHQLVLLRHGQSEYNKKLLFTGWEDPDLTPEGEKQSREAGMLLRERGLDFDLAFTSLLKRSIRTLWMVMEEMDLCWIPVEKSWRMNERHYGALQGRDKSQVVEEFGLDQAHRWRRGYEERPPVLSPEDPRHPRFDKRYRSLAPEDLPAGESLRDTVLRLLPLWQEGIMPAMKREKSVIISGHGNSLRALLMVVAGITPQEIMEIDVPTGIPLVLELDDSMRLVDRQFLIKGKKLEEALQREAGLGI